MARAALQIGVRELAESAQVSPTTITRLERGEALYSRTVESIRTALEAAGVIFVEENGEGPGVRLKKEMGPMTLESFLTELRRYEQLGRHAKGIQSRGQVIFPGYRLVSSSPERVHLMVENTVLGHVTWHNGRVVFDPLLSGPVKDRSFEEDLDEWMSLAQLRRMTGAV